MAQGRGLALLCWQPGKLAIVLMVALPLLAIALLCAHVVGLEGGAGTRKRTAKLFGSAQRGTAGRKAAAAGRLRPQGPGLQSGTKQRFLRCLDDVAELGDHSLIRSCFDDASAEAQAEEHTDEAPRRPVDMRQFTYSLRRPLSSAATAALGTTPADVKFIELGPDDATEAFIASQVGGLAQMTRRKDQLREAAR